MDKEEDKVIFLKKKNRFRITMDTYVVKRPAAGEGTYRGKEPVCRISIYRSSINIAGGAILQYESG